MYRQLNHAQVLVKALVLSLALMLPCARGWNAATLPQNLAKAPVVDEATKRRAVQMLQSGPAVFIENQGQWPEPAIHFALSGGGVNVGLAESSLRFQLLRREAAA